MYEYRKSPCEGITTVVQNIFFLLFFSVLSLWLAYIKENISLALSPFNGPSFYCLSVKGWCRTWSASVPTCARITCPPPRNISQGSIQQADTAYQAYNKDKYRREGKGRHCCNHLAARIIWRKVFGRTFILGGWWFWCGVNRMIIHFSKDPFQKVPLAVILVIFFFNSSWYKIASVVKQQQRPLASLLYLSLIYATRPA